MFRVSTVAIVAYYSMRTSRENQRIYVATVMKEPTPGTAAALWGTSRSSQTKYLFPPLVVALFPR